MSGLETLTVILQGLVPLVLIGAVTWSHSSRLSWGLELAIAATYLFVIAVAGLWLALPRQLVLAYAVLLVAAAAFGAQRRHPETNRPTSLLGRARIWARAAALVVLVGTSVAAVLGRRMPSEDPVDLSFPLAHGTYLIAAGGSNEIVNPHRKTASGERYRRWVGQSHAVDLVKVGSWGSREAALSPDDPSGFAIFGDPISAPCSGTVVAAVDGQPDVLAPGARPSVLEGNHTILECGDVWVVLAHFQLGSVRVSPGDHVRTGDSLGRVGNSGQSDEPHLHIHAQTPGTQAAPLGGRPIPITFDGRYLVRNETRAKGEGIRRRSHGTRPKTRALMRSD
jgi:hypothetical protein